MGLIVGIAAAIVTPPQLPHAPREPDVWAFIRQAAVVTRRDPEPGEACMPHINSSMFNIKSGYIWWCSRVSNDRTVWAGMSMPYYGEVLR